MISGAVVKTTDVPPIAAKEIDGIPSAEILIKASGESTPRSVFIFKFKNSKKKFRSSEIPFRIVTTPTFEEEDDDEEEVLTVLFQDWNDFLLIILR